MSVERYMESFYQGIYIYGSAFCAGYSNSRMRVKVE